VRHVGVRSTAAVWPRSKSNLFCFLGVFRVVLTDPLVVFLFFLRSLLLAFHGNTKEGEALFAQSCSCFPLRGQKKKKKRTTAALNSGPAFNLNSRVTATPVCALFAS
jgi:hypothetical protein